MCGIAGEIRHDGRAADPDVVRRMTDRLAPRGPDGQGLECRGPVALGHRRLKIIDLSDRAAQPMVDRELGLTLVFNGCIYNYRELRAELEARDYEFFSTSDSEVILKAFHAWGSACVERFNGMFAFVIHDDRSGDVFGARDRLGIKPFYYQATPAFFRFASTLPALVAAGDVSPALDPAALHYYLSFHSVVPPPHTLLADVRKLPPATRLWIGADGRRREERYWSPAFGQGELAQASFDDCRQRVLDGLRAAVARRTVADVPVGVLLSGGVDSSLLVGLLAEAGAHGLNTFTIGFEDVGTEIGNEFQYSDLIAAEFGTLHHRLEVDSRELLAHLPDCFAAMSEPMVSHDNIGFYLLSREVSRHVKVVQSGQGADEVFGGYFWYPPLLESTDDAADYMAAFLDRDHDELSRVLHPRWLERDFSREFIVDQFAAANAATAVDKALLVDTTVMLVDDPVKRVDNMTMAWGLEARVPFLDHELVELAASITPAMKVGFGGKFVLKEAAREVIPAEVIDRPKGYFPVPALKYLEGDSLAFVADALNGSAARERGLFRREYVDLLLDAPAEHLTPLNGSKLWQVAALEIWLQTHGL